MTTPYCSPHRWVVFGAVLPSRGLLLSAPPVCWLTFIYRTTGLRAVEDFVGGVLLTLVGLTLTFSVSWALLPIPHFCLDYSTGCVLCQDFFLFFLQRFSPSSLSGGTVFHEPF